MRTIRVRYAMAAVWVLARARLRTRWRILLGLALLVGVASGAVMVAAWPGWLAARTRPPVALRAE